MTVTVTVSRGNALAWPIALLFTIVGAALVVAGFTVVGKVEVPGGGASSNAILDVVAAVLIVPAWFFYGRSLLRRARARRIAVAGADAPRELTEPPGHDDPAVVAVVVGKGEPSGRAVAATVLGLAARDVIDVQEYGDKVVIDIRANAAAANATDQLVLDALRARADNTGAVAGPPIWDDVSWWRDYVRDARGRAIAGGLVEQRIPLVGLMLVCVLTATGLALIFFWYIAAFVGLILLANGLPHLIARASGFRLSAAGVASRAQWIAFGRCLHGHESLHDVGPAGVAIWGPNLVYGVLVGAGDMAARALSPDVGHGASDSDLLTEYTVEL